MSHAAKKDEPSGQALCGIGSGGWLAASSCAFASPTKQNFLQKIE